MRAVASRYFITQTREVEHENGAITNRDAGVFKKICPINIMSDPRRTRADSPESEDYESRGVDVRGLLIKVSPGLSGF